MADLKISQLTGASTPLAGTEVLPIVQSGTTKQVSVANLTAGRSVSAKFLTATGTQGGSYGLTVTNTTNNAPGFVQISGTGTNGGGEIDFINGASTGWGGIKCVAINKIEFLAGNYSTMVAINDGNVVINNGKGIDFSATAGTGTSELLADYEEGTWTPTIASNSGAITSYTSSGTYTKIGRQVTLMIAFTITNNGTGAGDIRITNLPFSTSADTLGNGCGREGSVNGFMQNLIVASANTIGMYRYDNAYPGATGASFKADFTYFV